MNKVTFIIAGMLASIVMHAQILPVTNNYNLIGAGHTNINTNCNTGYSAPRSRR